MERPFEHHFDWDPVKARQNFGKHGVSFERAVTVFLDPEAMSIFDERHSLEEERWITLGLDRMGILLVVCHTHREARDGSADIRLISARRATKKESGQYARK